MISIGFSSESDDENGHIKTLEVGLPTDGTIFCTSMGSSLDLRLLRSVKREMHGGYCKLEDQITLLGILG